MVVLAILLLAFAGEPFADLKADLGLSGPQISQLSARPLRTAAFQLSLLNDEQRIRVREIASILNRQEAAMQAVGLGILTCDQWAPTCACYWYPIHEDKIGIGLREAQMFELERARREHASRDAVLAMLDPEQRAKVEHFVREVLLSNEAIDLGLIPRPSRGEVLCH